MSLSYCSELAALLGKCKVLGAKIPLFASAVERGGLQHGFVELVQLALLRFFDLLLDVQGQKLHSVVDGFWDLRFAFGGQLAAVHSHVRQPVVVQVNRARLIQVQFVLI